MPAKQDPSEYIGKKFGSLTIIKYTKSVNWVRMVLAVCTCGLKKKYRLRHIISGDTKSCGCQRGFNGKGHPAIDSVGKRFGKIIIKSLVCERNKKPIAVCVCDCGNCKKIRLADLRNGLVKSCGCIRNIKSRQRMLKHGFCKHPLYSVWKGMKQRCYNKNEKCFKNYGGRGVRVCKEWINDFKAFYNWAMTNGYKRGLNIDKDIKAREMGIEALLYSPDMCMFVTTAENNKVQRKRTPKAALAA